MIPILGCQSGMLGGTRFTSHPQSNVILAGDFGDANDAQSKDDKPNTPSTKTYTSPGATARKLSFLSGLASSSTAGSNLSSDRAADAAQSAVGRGGLQGSIQTTGPMGMSLGSPVVVQAVGKQGLLQGGALGGGFLTNNVFRAGQRSFAQGCDSLIRAGFFPNQAACNVGLGR